MVDKKIPSPPHAHIRSKPLPWQQPKSVNADPDASIRIRSIQDSFAYRQADQDVDFLNHDAVRGVRLEIDYLKAELLLQQHDIKHTIVIFGSTRLDEPCTAKARVEQLQNLLAADPHNREIGKRLAVAIRILAKSRYYDEAKEFGRLVGEAGWNQGKNRLVIMTGGGPGIMEAANRGADQVGAKSVGLNITLPHEQFPNPYVTPGLCFSFHYFAIRKLHFLQRTKALVAFPGGFGTFDELFESLTLIQTRKIKPLPVILVGEEYWRKAFNIDFLVDEGVIDEEDRQLFWYAETAQEAWTDILHWHRENGTPLLEVPESTREDHV